MAYGSCSIRDCELFQFWCLKQICTGALMLTLAGFMPANIDWARSHSCKMSPVNVQPAKARENSLLQLICNFWVRPLHYQLVKMNVWKFPFILTKCNQVRLKQMISEHFELVRAIHPQVWVCDVPCANFYLKRYQKALKLWNPKIMAGRNLILCCMYPPSYFQKCLFWERKGQEKTK